MQRSYFYHFWPNLRSTLSANLVLVVSASTGPLANYSVLFAFNPSLGPSAAGQSTVIIKFLINIRQTGLRSLASGGLDLCLEDTIARRRDEAVLAILENSPLFTQPLLLAK